MEGEGAHQSNGDFPAITFQVWEPQTTLSLQRKQPVLQGTLGQDHVPTNSWILVSLPSPVAKGTREGMLDRHKKEIYVTETNGRRRRREMVMTGTEKEGIAFDRA